MLETIVKQSPVQGLMKVLPDGVLQELQNIRELESDLGWRYGDVVQMLMDYVNANNLSYTLMDVCSFIAWTVDYQRSSFTIRDYYMVARQFGYSERQQYSHLPFSHFKLAWQTNDMSVLKKSDEMLEQYGKPPSVSSLKKQTSATPTPIPAITVSQPTEMMNVTGAIELVKQARKALPSTYDTIRSRSPKAASIVAQAALLLDDALAELGEPICLGKQESSPL